MEVVMIPKSQQKLISITKKKNEKCNMSDDYYELQRKNDQLLIALGKRESEIERLEKKISSLTGNDRELEINNKILDNSMARMSNLKLENHRLKSKSQRDKRTYSARQGGLTKKHNKKMRSYAARLGSHSKWYSETEDALTEIYKHCQNNRLRNIAKFKEKIGQLCEYAIDFCSECHNPNDKCACPN